MGTAQCDKVLAYMKKFGSITKFEALNDIGCKNLASRISDLRGQGYAIGKKMRLSLNRYGDAVRYAEYYLIEED